MKIKGLKSQDFHIPDNGDGIRGDRAKRRLMNKNLSGGWRNSFLLWGLPTLLPPKAQSILKVSAPDQPLEPLRNARYDKPPHFWRTHEFLVLIIQDVLRHNRKTCPSRAS